VLEERVLRAIVKRGTSPEVLGRRQTIMGLMWKNACHAFTETTFPIF